MGGTIVEASGLRHLYGQRAALDGLSFTVSEGDVYGILGPNGCGKSTLFRILCTLERPQQGTAAIASVDAAKGGIRLRKLIGVVFQNGSLDRRLTVRENLIAQGHLQSISGPGLQTRVDELLAEFGLETRAGDEARTLSGGLKRKVEIAKAIIHKPRVLLLDEASTGLDPAARREMWAALNRLRTASPVTILFTTHLMDEADNATRLLMMSHGKAVAEDTPERLKARVGGDVVEFESESPGLADDLKKRFPVEVNESGGRISVETPAGHRFIAEAFEAFPGRITSASLHRPTLEDVFFRVAGELLEGSGTEAADA
ncbi:MAG TPA: ABC transporter ATP-binding protein [Bryobacteraceae bacterium]|nr:ABC transporter ATP-binding protein [Bryobacteraceae bacterium]HPT24992.1 ABC transporter ATP-binding protein [Bryobacteraceae bacterium]